ncbi:hypothetical protein CP972_33235 [Streptomyces prasinus]|uniref:Uncharacterized protein n=1 Tax=Streptomyces prasinus TaxID=67345 RepID=A0ABX6B6E0_9ACTN|nr:hypothetical protein CP972_33235 [Streptomyces prasinus]
MTPATVRAPRPGADAPVSAVDAARTVPGTGDVLFGPVVSPSARVPVTAIAVLDARGPDRGGRRPRAGTRAPEPGAHRPVGRA